MMMKRRWFGLAVVASIALTSCATGPIKLDMQYPRGAASESSVPVPQACIVKIDRISDLRTNKQTLGHYGALPIYGENIEDWLRHALIDLEAFGYSVAKTDTASPTVSMNADLTQAYVQGVLTSLESAVRLNVRYTRLDGSTIERKYRGSYVKLNWVAASDEMMGTLNHAMARIIRDIAKDLPAFCGK